MDPLEPWIDASAVRRLAECLLSAPAESSIVPAPDAGFGRDFIGFASEAESSTPPFDGIAKSSLERASGVEQDPVERPLVSDARAGLLGRLLRFRELVIRHVGAQGIFILDRDGQPVLEDESLSKWYFLARSLSQSYGSTDQSGAVHVRIAANALLEVVLVEMPSGRLVLGIVVSQSLGSAMLVEIAAALQQAATVGGGNLEG